MAGGGPGDVVGVTVTASDGTVVYDLSVTFDRAYRHTDWYWNRAASGKTGTWTLTVFANAAQAATYLFTVS